MKKSKKNMKMFRRNKEIKNKINRDALNFVFLSACLVSLVLVSKMIEIGQFGLNLSTL